MLAAVQLAIHVCHMSGFDEMQRMFDTITYNSAKTFGISESYGLEPGCRADFVVLDARSVLDAIRLSPARLYVVKGGRVVAQTETNRSRVFYDTRTQTVDYRKE